jgi:hypothetical protein
MPRMNVPRPLAFVLLAATEILGAASGNSVSTTGAWDALDRDEKQDSKK